MVSSNIKETPAQIATVYTNYLKAFLKRADVQNGSYVSYHDNQDPNGPLKPENWVNLGDARVTTGFCVSFSQAILNDELFKLLLDSRGALAKIVSIDIKEQYYGHCKPSYVQNKWHSAIYVRDNDMNFILDPTCAQFGNQFVGKFVWDFETWIKTFRSPNDTHKLTDFLDNPLVLCPIETNVKNYSSVMIDLTNALHDVTTITDTERRMLADFFLKGIEVLNRKIDLGNLTDNDFKYTANINRLAKQIPFKINNNEQYFVMGFMNLQSAKRWLNKLNEQDWIMPYYLMLSDSVEDSCKYFGIDYNDINKESSKEKTYIIIRFVDSMGSDVKDILNNVSTFVPYGIKVYLKNLYNGGEELPETAYGIKKKTNTIVLNLSMQGI